MSQIDLEVVQKLSARQWQDLLDRVANRDDERIFLWIKDKEGKIREDDWREFEKALHLYLKKKDTSVFSDPELFEIYDSLYEMGVYWRKAFKQFSVDHPKSDKIKSKGRRSKKFQTVCLEIKRTRRVPLDESVFSEAFSIAMK